MDVAPARCAHPLHLVRLLAGVLLLAVSARAQVPALTEPAFTEPAQIAQTAERAALAHLGRSDPTAVEAQPVDPRLRPPACAGPLGAGVAPGLQSASRLVVEVRCAQPRWHVYVQVRVTARERVVATTRPVSRQGALAAEDLVLVERDLAALPGGYYRDPAAVLGKLAARTLGAGEVLTPDMLHIPPLVHRGQVVTLLARQGALSVRASGVAESDAGLDQRVRVRNAATARYVEGVVRAADLVEVALP